MSVNLISESELAEVMRKLSPHAAMLDEIVDNSAEALEGNILYMHQSFNPNPKNLPKQINLFSLAASLPSEDAIVIEIGFNAGHSSLLMLSAHPKLRIIAFDLCEHAYTVPCFEALSAIFPGRLQLVPGRSQKTLPLWARSHALRADLFHIDGDHSPEGALLDLQQAQSAARPGAWVVFDDTCFTPLKAVWEEVLTKGLLRTSEVQFCSTNRHGIARYVRPPSKGFEDLLYNISPALQHRGRQRNVLVLAPIDHGQDSLLGYLLRHRSWQGRATQSQTLAIERTQRHQSPCGISVPLRVQLPSDPVASLLHLVAPPFHDDQKIVECFPLVDGILVVVDCAEQLSSSFRTNFAAAAMRGLQPVLFMNKLDKLLALEPDNEVCYQRLANLLDELNALLGCCPPSVRPLAVQEGNVLFGRGSLSVAESIGGWGFDLDAFLVKRSQAKGWTEEQVLRLKPRLWGDNFINDQRWGSRGERGFCKLVLQPIREIFTTLESRDPQGLEKLDHLGVAPRAELSGNAWKQSALESWLPLVDTLLFAVAKCVPPPQEPPEDAVFYAAQCLASSDGRNHFAFGRDVAPTSIGLGRVPDVTTSSQETWFINGQTAVKLAPTGVAGNILRSLMVKESVQSSCVVEIS